MLLELTLAQLDIGQVSQTKAEELGHLGYLQWLGSLPGNASYVREAMRAYEMAGPAVRTSPAVAVFCDLLLASTATPLQPLDLKLRLRSRRGGARARRDAF
ncbi:MAG: hypothetical protein QNI90_05615 [Dinoroseobacter sp.]|nr:hypothetical protein [Dinoroseobacter sp.]MDJ0993030.1 hypothetical protein [Dinoroseobacter sp.]